ncbi:MAG TPA: hypothetical protein VJ914_37400 [Pseudonocardiaceae bacterium]|nr:hypothetical protein [Pseudonocardiaceae bacterium]
MQRKKTLALAAATAAAAVLAVVQPFSATAAPTANNGQAPLTAQQASDLAQNVNTPVIVLMKNQPGAQAVNTPAATTRNKTISGIQAPLVNELSQVHARNVHSYHVADAVSATVSAGEANRLAANPNVAAVLPDSVIKEAPAMTAGKSSGTDTTAPAGVCPAPGKTMLEPEALDVTHTDSDDPNAKTARSLGFTGDGVKVAYIAEGIDVNNPDFIRANGSHVFADYQDFTGDGPNATTSGGEAFLDASAIAAQGRQTYNVQNWGAHPLPTPCDIRVEGVAPGASLYGFKVFGNANTSTTSAILQSIDYAVNTDHVNVINESFGYNPFGDSNAADAVKLFDDMAVASGVTVVASSGDAGTTGTQGSPSTDPAVISAGASTTFRWYAQTDYGAADNFPITGWLNDNVSSLSSSGVTQDGTTLNLLAPGDSSFALCTPSATYEDCADFNGNPSDLERSGGTSESSPLTAGAAALVIQAYRQAHHGATPSPATIKQILTSTADDLTEPGDEQGAGLLDSYKAVEAALSIHDGNGAPAAVGSTLLVDKSQLDASGPAGSTKQFKLNVTNNGATAQTVNLSGRGFGPQTHKQTGSVTLSDTASPHFADWSGVSNNYGTLTFNVPAGTDRLSASIAYPGNPAASLNARVRLILIDPNGKFAAHSLPQGVGNYGNVDVRFPAAGKWTAEIYSRVTGNGGTTGTVKFEADTQNTTGYGSVSPATLNLAPGQSKQVTVTEQTPATPGDASGALVLNAGAAGQTSVPIVLRSLVSASGNGAFAGTLTGGNGRQSDLGQESFYQIDVPAGKKDLDANVALTNDSGDNVIAFLIDPRGNVEATGSNAVTTAYDPAARNATQHNVLQTDLYARNPRPGRWTLAINFVGAIVGDELHQPYNGAITFNKVDVTAAGLPNSGSTVLPAGKPVTVQVAVHNTGTEPQDFFVDARTQGLQNLKLAGIAPTSNVALPFPSGTATPAWLVPSQTVGATVVANATLPVTFDYGPYAGDPDLPPLVSGKTAIGATVGNPLPSGGWAADPAEVGPTGPNGGPAGTANFSFYALTKGFDSSVSSTATDLWATSVTPATSFNLVTVNPGQTVNIPVTITPTGKPGTVVSGTAYVDQFLATTTAETNAINFTDTANYQPNADELVALPYSYRIG